MNPRNLLKLLSDNRRAPHALMVEAGNDEATIYLYDVIVSDDLTAEWCGGVAPESFNKTLAAITAPTIHLRINSPGGDVFACRAIEAAIKNHPSQIIAHIDGYAASAASIVALAADEVEIGAGAFYMVHNSWTLAYGNADDLLTQAALLEKVDGTLAASYAARTGASMEQVRAWMDAETWFTGQEAVDAGFADRVAEAPAKAATTAAQAWDLSAFANTPKPAAGQKPPVAASKLQAARAAAENALEAAEAAAKHNTDHLRRKLDLIATAA